MPARAWHGTHMPQATSCARHPAQHIAHPSATHSQQLALYMRLRHPLLLHFFFSARDTSFICRAHLPTWFPKNYNQTQNPKSCNDGNECQNTCRNKAVRALHIVASLLRHRFLPLRPCVGRTCRLLSSRAFRSCICAMPLSFPAQVHSDTESER